MSVPHGYSTGETAEFGTPTLANMPSLKRDILLHLSAVGPIHGLGLKDHLETYYANYDEDPQISRGRLYPNLDDLVEMGFIEKGVIDQRTNSYELTDRGDMAVTRYAERTAFLAGIAVVNAEWEEDA